MLKLTCLFLMLGSFVSQAQPANPENSVIPYRVTSVVRFENNDSVYNQMFSDTMIVYFSGKMILYEQLHSHFYSYSTNVGFSSSFDTTLSRYMIFDTTDTEGFFYSDLEDFGWKKIDSFKQKLSFIEYGRNMIDILQSTEPSNKTLNGDIVFESYRLNNTQDSSVAGTITFKYNLKTDKYPLSLSPEIDSLKQMKLYEIRVEMPQFFSKEKNCTSNAFSITTSLEYYPLERSDAFIKSLKKYSSEKQKKGRSKQKL